MELELGNESSQQIMLTFTLSQTVLRDTGVWPSLMPRSGKTELDADTPRWGWREEVWQEGFLFKWELPSGIQWCGSWGALSHRESGQEGWASPPSYREQNKA